MRRPPRRLPPTAAAISAGRAALCRPRRRAAAPASGEGPRHPRSPRRAPRPHQPPRGARDAGEPRSARLAAPPRRERPQKGPVHRNAPAVLTHAPVPPYAPTAPRVLTAL